MVVKRTLMKCKNCGGNLKYENDIFICESCQTKYSINDYFEANDVYLCYVENDNNGRRSKDSIIAQELYSVLVENKIETFYPRNVNDSFVGKQYNTICNCALNSAKIIIVIGTNTDNFKLCFEEYKDFAKSKTVIPVFSDMGVSEVPKDISIIQAINYNKIGSNTDLVRSILNVLGREKELELAELSKKHNLKKKTITITLILIFIFAIIASVAYVVFGTTLVLPSKQYEYAMSCIETNNRIEAIRWFDKLSGYKDSNEQIKKIFDSYTGYYYDENSNMSVHLTIYEGNNANLQLEKITNDGDKIKISETAQIEFDRIIYNFLDSEDNNGTITIILNNDGFSLSLINESKGEVFISDYENVFSIKDKSDAPLSKIIDKEYLLNIINNQTTLNDLKRDGFDVTFVAPILEGTDNCIYKIDDTDILLEVHSYDASVYGNRAGTFDLSDVKKLSEPIIFAVNAPAVLIIPNEIGQLNKPFIKNDVIYVPNAEFNLGFRIDYGLEFISETIKNNTKISFVSKSKLTKDDFEEFSNAFNAYYIAIAESTYNNTYCKGDFYPYADIVAENSKEFLIGTETSDDNLPLVYYRVNKANGNIQCIKEFSKGEIISEMPKDNWTYYSEYFQDFID